MDEHRSESNKDLVFENTPLQNLKNILSDADASMEETTTQRDGAGQQIQEIEESSDGVSKAAVRKVIHDLTGLAEQYIARGTVQKIFYELWYGQRPENCNALKDPTMLKLEALVNAHKKNDV